jgi:hypothetical protein
MTSDLNPMKLRFFLQLELRAEVHALRAEVHALQAAVHALRLALRNLRKSGRPPSVWSHIPSISGRCERHHKTNRTLHLDTLVA